MNKTYPFLLLLLLAVSCLAGGCLVTRNTGETTPLPPGTAVPVQTGTPVATGHAGSGNMSLQVPFQPGLYIVQAEQNGTGLFLVEISNNDFYQQVIRSSGNLPATQASGIPIGGMYWLNVTSNGTWDVTLARPEGNVPPAPPLTLTGTGPETSGYVDLAAKATSFFLKNDGAGPFAVWLYNESGGFVFDPTGTFVQPLPNHFGAYNGTIDVAIPEEGRYVVNVMSDGEWEVGIF
ncbi:MAG: hypothetical protein HGA55_00545 [Methanoregulaceae archaeon]|nr:hypothetical protein [Methanoregulaceae archaeon]